MSEPWHMRSLALLYNLAQTLTTFVFYCLENTAMLL